MITSLAIQTLSAGALYAFFGAYIFTKLKGRSNRWIYISWTMTSVLWFTIAAGLYMDLGLYVAELCAKITYTAIVFIPVMMLHYLSAYLGDNKNRRWIQIAYAAAAVFAVTVWIDGIFLKGCWIRPWGYYPRASWMHAIFLATVLAQTNYFYWQVTRALKDPSISPVKREQIRYIRRGILWYAASSHDFLINYGVHSYPLAPWLSVIGLGHFAYAVVRHQLLDIHVIVRRTLVYSVASTILTSLYVGILFVTVELLRPFFGGKSWESVIIACVITAFCHPLIRRVQNRIDHWLGRSRLDHSVELMKFSSELGQDESIERARNLLGRIIDDAFRPNGFVIYRRSADGFDLFVQKGMPQAPDALETDNPWVKRFEANADAQDISGMVIASEQVPGQAFAVRAAAPLINQKQLRGFILLGDKRLEEPYNEQDLILLRIVANQAAVALDRPFLIKEVGAGFAHEIKTPLANIAMPAELCVLELQDVLAQGYKDVRQRLPVLVKRLEYIVDQALFASSRVDAMQQLSEAASAVRSTPVALRDIAENAAAALSQLTHEAGVRIENQVADELTILGDPPQIEILVTNLMKNAIEALAGSAERRIVIQARSKDDQVMLDVEDSGPGIPAKDAARVFEPHFSTKTGYTRGMGLYIARRIAAAHQATLSYQRRGRWTVMRVAFPATVEQSV